MENKTNIYVSLDEARIELARRRNDATLMNKIEADLGDQMWPIFKNRTRGVLTKYLPSPDNGFVFFVHMAHYVGTVPFTIEFLGDLFVNVNEEKKGLGLLRLTLEDGTKATVDIMDFRENEKKKIGECVLKTGEKLVDFHHNLLEVARYGVDIEDGTPWLRETGKKIDYYKYLLHFVAHGVLFECYPDEDEDEREGAFTRNVVLPAMDKIQKNYGLKPLIITMYPENQSEEEDFFWWSYPPNVNDYLVDYARKNKLSLKVLLDTTDKGKIKRLLSEYVADMNDPDAVFEGVMSIPNCWMTEFYKLCPDIYSEEAKREIRVNPRSAKIRLACEIVRFFHGEAEAESSKEYLVTTIPCEIPEIVVIKEEIKLIEFLILSGLTSNNSNARRNIVLGKVESNGEQESDWRRVLTKSDDGTIFKVAKMRTAKIKFMPPRK